MASAAAGRGPRGLEGVQIEPQTVIRWAKREDIPDMARILTTNLMVFELHDHFVPSRKEHPDEFYDFLLNRVKLFFVKPETRYMVAEITITLPTSLQRTEIIGFGAWEAQGAVNVLGQEWRHQRSGWSDVLERSLVRVELEYYRHFLNRIVDYSSLAECMRRLHTTYEDRPDLRNCLHLQFLMVAPEWQKSHGVGRRILQWGIDVADQLGLPIVIESSLVAYEFYLKHGFELLQTVHIDLVRQKAYDMPIVYRVPKASTPSRAA